MIKRDHPDYGDDRGLKVKSVLRKEDTDIRMSGLLSWLRNEIRERDQKDQTYENKAKTISKGALSQDSIMAGVDERDLNVQVISPVHKNKTNKKNISIAGKFYTKKF
jgi:translation initiation factor 2-alpha kinase 4